MHLIMFYNISSISLSGIDTSVPAAAFSCTVPVKDPGKVGVNSFIPVTVT